ncbi:type I-E CRISPR-associated protein Cas5/CasD [Streptomyces uncialis]|uniref:type I-E CRISPR-associated protein Cas5/CasD n=1 Tax=Streptomyces uncialis TaxID=1048205 RepID=UPI0037AD67C8
MGGGGSVVELMRSMGLAPEVVSRLSVLWGKSAARNGGRRHLLLGHLLDTAAVGGVMWGEYLAPSLRRRLDEVSGGRGREWFMWVCGIHDFGKATPAFQSVDADEAARVVAAGLTWRRWQKSKRLRHDVAGGALLAPLLREVWGREAAGWVWPLVAGHHGAFPSVGSLGEAPRELLGRGPEWAGVQRALVEVFTRAVGFEDLRSVCPVSGLRKAEQLALSGLVVMADWIASDHSCFGGLSEAGLVSVEGARGRAVAGWSRLGLRGGWGRLPVPGGVLEPLEGRLGVVPRASQAELVERVWAMPVPGLVVVEAPMGEGKTKGALAAAEVLAARFGLDGVFVAMPTQATSDPMYEQVLSWVASFGAGLVDQVALLHGKRRFNQRWRGIWEASPAGGGGDEFGAIDEDGEFGFGPGSCGEAERDAPRRWFLGSRRGLLTGFAVGTVDHLLYAATRTRHVMLRFAGLAGKVVIIDEVHAADVYMRQFLVEALRWLGQAGVPVVLLSATLPPAQRQSLVDAYLAGAVGRADVSEAVPSDQPGTLLRDYHTVSDHRGHPLLSSQVNAKGVQKKTSPAKHTGVTQRYYLQDAVFVAALRGPASLLETLDHAVRNPVFPLSLGRRSCPPTGPVSLGVHPDAELTDTLSGVPWKAADHHRSRTRGTQVTLEATVEDAQGEHTAEDTPDTYDLRTGTVFSDRTVRHTWVTVPTGHPPSANSHPPRTDPASGHDPFALMGW